MSWGRHRARWVTLPLVAVAAWGVLRWRKSYAPVVDASTVAIEHTDAQAERWQPELPAREIAAGTRMLHGDPARRHRARALGPRTAQLLWKLDLGAALETQPIVSADGRTAYLGTLGGSLVAVDLASASIRWRHELGNRVYGTPVVDGEGNLFFGHDGGAMVSLRADGSRRFRFETEVDCDTAALLTAAGNVVAACGPSLYVWSRSFTVQASPVLGKKVYSAPALLPSGAVVVGSQGNEVAAFDAAGAPLWRTDLGADVDGGVAIDDDGDIYVGTDAGEVVKLDGKGGVRWRTRIGHAVRGALSIARNGDVLAGSFGASPALHRLAPDGQERWRFTVPGSGANEFGVRGGALEDAAGRLYFGAQDDKVRALDGGGALLFELGTGGDVDAPLTLLDDGRLLVASDDGNLYCLGA